MSGDVGGSIYVRASSFGSLEAVGRAVTYALVSPRIGARIGLDPNRPWEVTLDHTLTSMAPDDPFYLHVLLADYLGTIFIGPAEQGYYALQLTFPQTEFTGGGQDPQSVEVFARKWITLCDEMGATFGTFAGSDYMTTDEACAYTRGQFVADDVSLVRGGGVSWLVYVGVDLAARWAERLEPVLSTEFRVRLPSGALAIEYTNSVNWNYGYAMLHSLRRDAQFLLNTLEPHSALPGVAPLIPPLREALTGPIALIESHATDDVTEEDARRVRRLLDDGRALWVTASTRVGLVGVNQPVTLREADGGERQVVAPIVARDGAEWVVPAVRALAGLPPDAQTSERVPGAHGGGVLPARLRELLVAAQQHPGAGVVPRVALVAWGGLSEATRHAVEALGVPIEVPDAPLPLLPPRMRA